MTKVLSDIITKACEMPHRTVKERQAIIRKLNKITPEAAVLNATGYAHAVQRVVMPELKQRAKYWNDNPECPMVLRDIIGEMIKDGRHGPEEVGKNDFDFFNLLRNYKIFLLHLGERDARALSDIVSTAPLLAMPDLLEGMATRAQLKIFQAATLGLEVQAGIKSPVRTKEFALH